jgi:AcrR family transcriptional regulator
MPRTLAVASTAPPPPIKKKRRGPRVPQQERSQQLVEAILTAATLLVRQHGLAALTMSGIARRAGVSVGSLYQYFPSKRTILMELRRRHQEHGKRLFLAEAAALVSTPVPEATRRFVAKMFEVHAADPELHRALEREGREVGVSDWERQAMQIVRIYYERHKHELAVDDLDEAAFLVCATTEAVTHGAVTERPELLRDGRLQESLTRMLLGYLTGK